MRRIVFLFVLLLAAVSCSDRQKDEAAKPETRSVKAHTAVAEKAEVPSSRTFSATVSSNKTALIIPKIVGYIESVHFAPGDSFRQGDLLVSIKSGELEEKKRFAESSVAEAETGLRQAEVSLALAEKTFQRYSNLIKNNSVSRQEYDQIEAQFNLAQEQVRQAATKKRQAEAMYAEVKTYLSYTGVRAPFDGIVLEKLVDAGNLAAPGSPILKIGSKDTVVYAFINESLFNSLKTGMRAGVEAESINFSCESEITEISPDIDPATRNFRIKLNGNDRFVTGMYVKVILPTGTGKKIILPSAAVVQRGQLSVVFVVKDSRADMRIVKTGQTFAEGIEIISGLNEGETYVADNASSLRTGDIIEAM
ncbi:efflux RND transporter periplasmic adaptor subunit [Geovibrio thiophilus]|uniref:Efflux RND transporter periplasmic adaptor subunit n=1 Tax=Geovibrio thiophilus TaxID=139438 RepID=A0A3R5UX68_9BACT|nr:efflux RND transporter periplasmic adaptor subunit [Geovibrio thiophilus]QAR32004.1 efflux RND transporter periplasmic adaptor subunit [Geovibrio thiophilus]